MWGILHNNPYKLMSVESFALAFTYFPYLVTLSGAWTSPGYRNWIIYIYPLVAFPQISAPADPMECLPSGVS